MINNLVNKFFSGHQRSVKAKKNIIASLFLKGSSILINLILIPLTIDYLNPTKFGIWITLTSVIAWFNFFDIGLGNGLRNKFATAKAAGDIRLVRTYISTTYAIITIISILFFILFFIINQFLDWGVILNTSYDVVELERLVFIVFSVFCLQFIIKLINVVFVADQRPAMSSLINTIGSLISLVAVITLMNYTEGSLLYLGASFSIINLVVPFIAGLWVFNTSYKKYKPTIKFIDFSYAKELLSLGTRFFIMQGAALIVFMTDNIIITQISGPQAVTPYNIAFKYFGIVTIFFTIITTPYWSAFTEAYIKNEISWIKNIMKKAMALWCGFFGITVVLLLLSNFVYDLWIGPEVVIPFRLSMVMALYVTMTSSIMIFGNFLSGVGKIKLSVFHSIFVGIINIPLSIYFAKNLDLGSTGVMLATCCGILISMVFQPIQCYKIIKGTATGLWNK
ncbi:MAG: MATE family efflux transporter [Flavobacteriales bacterium]|nr:MATE family efflux transporter [Flavobacteriales bacterium]